MNKHLTTLLCYKEATLEFFTGISEEFAKDFKSFFKWLLKLFRFFLVLFVWIVYTIIMILFLPAATYIRIYVENKVNKEYDKEVKNILDRM